MMATPADRFTPVADAAGPWRIEPEVYVPVYSSTYAGSPSLRSNLAATLSNHNTSRSESIVVRAVHYFDTNGNLVERFVDEPQRLGPMATVDFFIDAAGVRGGTGANFPVDWAAEAAASQPVIEAVMIGSIGIKGISFISRGTRLGTIAATSAPDADCTTSPVSRWLAPGDLAPNRSRRKSVIRESVSQPCRGSGRGAAAVRHPDKDGGRRKEGSRKCRTKRDRQHRKPWPGLAGPRI